MNDYQVNIFTNFLYIFAKRYISLQSIPGWGCKKNTYKRKVSNGTVMFFSYKEKIKSVRAVLGQFY